MSDLIIIRGPLGVGKTTIAKQLADDLSAKYFSIDDLMDEHDLDKEEHDIPVDNYLQGNKILLPQLQAVLKDGKSVVLDGNFYFQEAVDDLENSLSMKAKIFTLVAPLEVCLARDAARTNSLGQMATRAVYNLTMAVKMGVEIKANEKDIEEILTEIKQYLKK